LQLGHVDVGRTHSEKENWPMIDGLIHDSLSKIEAALKPSEKMLAYLESICTSI
jgi:hypothetical protein